MKKLELRLPTLLGLLVAGLGLATGLYLLRGPLNISLFASPEEEPRDTKVVNVTDNSFVVTWFTDKPTAGFVRYGEGSNAQDIVVSDDRDQENGAVGQHQTHFVTIGGLKPLTEYSYRIGSGGNVQSVTTGPTIADTPTADMAYGQVVTTNGEPAEGAIVFLEMTGATPLAALTKSSGSWVIPLATIRGEGLDNYFDYDREDREISLLVVGPGGEEATVATVTGNDSPVPAITLGSNYDLTQEQVSIEASESASAESRFSNSALESLEQKTVVLLSPKLDEKVNSPRPVVIGKAPAGAVVTVEIHSQKPIVGQVTVKSDDTFTYTVPENLEPGEHTITISTLIDGVVKKVSRTFVVYAAGESDLPAFSATPSATLVPTKVPTTTPAGTLTPTIKPTTTPSLSPTATPTLQPTTVPRVAMPASASAAPVSGSMDMTWWVTVLGAGLVICGLVLYKRGRYE